MNSHPLIIRQPQLVEQKARGLDFAVWHWPGPGEKLLFIHATGFHGRCWDQVVARLPDYDCWAFDMRGHGLSSKPKPPYQWREFGQDIIALAQALNLNFAVASGHSMGGHAVALAQAERAELSKCLVLIDPIILKKQNYGVLNEADHPVVRRRNLWQSPEEMFERFCERQPFKTWDRNVLFDYCRFAIVPNPNGDGFVLACRPEIEGSIYNQSSAKSSDIYEELGKITVPTLVLKPGDTPTPNAENLLPDDLETGFAKGEALTLPEQTHFIPMEVPEMVAVQVDRMAKLARRI